MDPPQNTFIGLMLQGIFYGIYCVIFVLYLRIQLQKKHESKSLLVYALCVNFILCTAYLALCMAGFLEMFLIDSSSNLQMSLVIAGDALYTCIDLISQGILIYRCWLMWRRPFIVLVPVILGLACLAISVTSLVPPIKNLGSDSDVPNWWVAALVATFSISLAVNAVVTGLIVLKIVIVRRGLQVNAFKSYSSARGNRYIHPIISILVESSMVTFVGQLTQTILWVVQDGTAFPLVSGIVVQLYGISPTIVVVRSAMGLAHDNETLNVPSSQAIHLAEIGSDDSRTPDVTGKFSMDKH